MGGGVAPPPLQGRVGVGGLSLTETIVNGDGPRPNLTQFRLITLSGPVHFQHGASTTVR